MSLHRTPILSDTLSEKEESLVKFTGVYVNPTEINILSLEEDSYLIGKSIFKNVFIW